LSNSSIPGIQNGSPELRVPNLSISRLLARRISKGKEHVIQEALMTRQLILSRGPKSIAGTALIGLGLLILFGNVDGAAAQLSGPLGNTAGEALGVLPSIILTAASQAFQACAFDHQYFLQGLFQMLVSSWLLLLVIVGALLLRAAFTSKV
jgi:hypothetical protein